MVRMCKPHNGNINQEELLGIRESIMDKLFNEQLPLDEYELTFSCKGTLIKVGTRRLDSQAGPSNDTGAKAKEHILNVKNMLKGGLKPNEYHLSFATEFIYVTIGTFILNERTEVPKILEPLRYMRKVDRDGSDLARSPILMYMVICCSIGTVTTAPFHTESVTLTEGTDGVVSFRYEWPPDSSKIPSVTVGLEGVQQPFYSSGLINPGGLIAPDQLQRIEVREKENEHSISVDIVLKNVSAEDEGTFVVKIFSYHKGKQIINYVSLKKGLNVRIPPRTAFCYLTRSDYADNQFMVHCHTTQGVGNTTLSCFQNGEKMPYIGKGKIVTRRTYWIRFNKSPVSCCSHDLEDKEITEETCKQFRWPRKEIKTKPIISTTKIVQTEKEVSNSPFPTVGSGCNSKDKVSWPYILVAPLFSLIATYAM